ncbi:MAG: 50S ribosomal protein L23 [Myxococcota bacterium]|nr:50S ribosomal protein L23 [Myxococcota bacterium]
MNELRDILRRPLITEKSALQMNLENTYIFEVGLESNKLQIKSAVESYFGVEVSDVRTLIVRGKSKRFGRHTGKRSNWKKAYVKLAEGHSLNFFEQ